MTKKKQTEEGLTDARQVIVNAISQAVGQLCQQIEQARQAASEAGLSIGYEVKHDSENIFVEFKAWAKEAA